MIFGLMSAFLTLEVQSANSSLDSLTRLPLPAAGAPVALYPNPSRLDDVPVCSSKSVMNLYSVQTGTVKAANEWYAIHLSGFKHVHGMGSGRSQDSYYNRNGTLVISITGKPAAEGVDTKVYSIIYALITPGVSDKVIAGMNIQKVVCP